MLRATEGENGALPRTDSDGAARTPSKDQTMPRSVLESLCEDSTFDRRHIGPDSADVEVMLQAIGYASLSALSQDVVPEAIRWAQSLRLPDALSERQTRAELRRLAARNHLLVNMIGLGYSGNETPAVIVRNVLESPAWYTAYTPYQPEISQGRLEALLNFQTLIEDLTALPVAGSSLLDEPTAAAEAMTLCIRASKGGVRRFAVDADLYPQTLAVLATRAEPMGIELVVADLARTPCDAGAEALRRASALVVVVPREIRAVAATQRLLRAMSGHSAPVWLVTRGPGHSGLDAIEVASALELELIADLRHDPRIAAAVERAEPLVDRGPLAHVADAVLAMLQASERAA